MPETLQQPLDNQEIVKHLALENVRLDQMQSQVPRQEDYMRPDDKGVHLVGNQLLINRVDHAGEDMVTANERGEHVFSSESLMADAGEFSGHFSAIVDKLQDAIKNPAVARKAIWEKREATNLTDDEARQTYGRSGNLNVREAKAYLQTLRETDAPEDQQQRDLRVAASELATVLVDGWRRRQDPSGVLVDEGLHLTDKHAEQRSEPDRLRRKFLEAHQQQVQELGETVLDAAGVRGRIAEHYGHSAESAPEDSELERLKEQHRKLNVRTGNGAGSRLPEDDSSATETVDPVVARGRELLRGANVSTKPSRPSGEAPAKETVHESEDARLAAAEVAARDGTLLGQKVEGITEAERREWIREKAEQIDKFILSPEAYKKLGARQKELWPEIHKNIYGQAADVNRQLRAIQGVRTVEANTPEDVSQLLDGLTPSLHPDSAKQIPEMRSWAAAAYANNPNVRLFVTFNVTGIDGDGKSILAFQHGRVG